MKKIVFIAFAACAIFAVTASCMIMGDDFARAVERNVIGGFNATNGGGTNVPYYIYGSNWTLADNHAGFSGRRDFGTIIYSNKLWVIGGYYYNSGFDYFYNDIWCTTDNTNWLQAAASNAFSKRYQFGLAEFHGRLWVIGGVLSNFITTNDVWYSADGTNWVLAANNAGFSPRSVNSALAFNGALWVIGSYNSSDVWYTLNGTNWLNATTNAAFTARDEYQAVSFNGSLWLIGGIIGGTNVLNDVWTSANGTNWSSVPVPTGSSFLPCYNHKVTVHSNQIWLVGGDYAGNGNHVYRSPDGTNWFHVTDRPEFERRTGHGIADFNGRLWLLAGQDKMNYYSNDVWFAK